MCLIGIVFIAFHITFSHFTTFSCYVGLQYLNEKTVIRIFGPACSCSSSDDVMLSINQSMFYFVSQPKAVLKHVLLFRRRMTRSRRQWRRRLMVRWRASWDTRRTRSSHPTSSPATSAASLTPEPASHSTNISSSSFHGSQTCLHLFLTKSTKTTENLPKTKLQKTRPIPNPKSNPNPKSKP